LVREAHRGGSPFWRQTAATDLFAAYLKKTPHSDTKTAPAQTPIDNNKKTPTSDNVGKHKKPPCNCMCTLEQSTSGTSQPEWTPEAIDDSAASKPPSKKKTPHSDTKTAPAQTTIDDDNKTTPTSDNVSELEEPLTPKPPCNCMCPLEQRASGPSKPEWTPEVVDGRVASKLLKKTTPHSDTKTAPVLTTIDEDVTLRRCAPRRPEGARRSPPWHRFPGA
jgi:hypothetical protein